MSYYTPQMTDAEWNKAYELVESLETADTEEQVLALMDGVTYNVFMALDEKPGHFDGSYTRNKWHMHLRRARNNPDNNLFDRLVK